jgi:hypothetical protein
LYVGNKGKSLDSLNVNKPSNFNLCLIIIIVSKIVENFYH